MKLEKIVILIFFITILTGCRAEYNLTYEDNIIKESLNVVSNNDNTFGGESFVALVDDWYKNKELLVSYRDQPGDMGNEEILQMYDTYNKSIIHNNGLYGINLNYDYTNYNDISNSTIIFSLFKNIYINENNIEAKSIRNIFDNYTYLNKITISFKTDKKVINTNCDEERDGIYYWYINKDNYENKDINIELDNNQDSITIDENGYFSPTIIKYIIMILAIIILILVGIIYEKVKKSND